MSSTERDNIKTLYNVLCYRIEFYFRDYKLAIYIDERRLSDRNIDCDKKAQRAIEQELVSLLELILAKKALIVSEI